MRKLQRTLVKVPTVLWIVILYAVASFIVIFPLMKSKVFFYGDDIVFQLNRIDNLVGYIKNGSILPILSSFAFKDQGIITNMVYPYQSLYLFAIIKHMVGDSILSIYLGMWILTLLTLLSSHFSMQVLTKSLKTAIIFAFTYTFCMYRMMTMISRFDLGELLAMCALPVFIVGLTEVLFDKYCYWPLIPFGATFIFSSHILTSVLLGLFTLVFFIVYCFAKDIKFKNTRNKYLIISLLSTVVLNCYQISLVCWGLLQKLQLPSIPALIDTDLDFFDILKNSISNNIDRSSTSGIGIVLIIMILLVLFNLNKIEFKYRVLFLTSLAFVIVSTSFVPWSLIQHTPLKIVQYSFRFLMIASCGISMVGAIVVAKYLNSKMVVSYLFFIVMLNLSIVLSFIHYNSVNSVTSNAPVVVEGTRILTDSTNYNRIVHGEWYLDYLPRQSDVVSTEIKSKKVITSTDNYKVSYLSISNGIQYTIKNKSGNHEQFDLPFVLYKHLNYEVRVDNSVAKTERSKRSTLLVNIPNGTHKVKVHLKIPIFIIFMYSINCKHPITNRL